MNRGQAYGFCDLSIVAALVLFDRERLRDHEFLKIAKIA
jgi:hypothetical protein